MLKEILEKIIVKEVKISNKHLHKDELFDLLSQIQALLDTETILDEISKYLGRTNEKKFVSYLNDDFEINCKDIECAVEYLGEYEVLENFVKMMDSKTVQGALEQIITNYDLDYEEE